MKKGATFILLVALLSSVSASAQSSKVTNVVKMAAWAQVLAERCPKLEINWSRFAGIMLIAGLKPEDIEPQGRHGKLHAGFIAEALNETKGTSETVSFMTGLTLYGENGRNAPGLLVVKQ